MKIGLYLIIHRSAIFLFCFLATPILTVAQNEVDTSQRDLIDYAMKFFKSKPPRNQDQSSRKVRFSIIPVTAGSGGQVAISAINLAFYRGEPDRTNLSTVYFYPYTSFTGRYSFITISNIWTSENKFNFIGDLKFSSNSYDDFGLGSSTTEDSTVVIYYNHTRIHLDVNRLLLGFFYAGLGYSLDYYYNLSQAGSEELTDFKKYPYGITNTTTSSGVSINLLRDSRKNSINPVEGYYGNLSFKIFHPSLGSSYAWNALYADVRRYFPLNTKYRGILSARVLYWETWGEVPYLDQPATFTDRESRVGRGYAYSRFRGKGMVYGEAEYRFSLSKNQFWGGVVFVNTQSLREPDSGKLEYINPAVGLGLRVKFNKRSDTNFTLDFAMGKDGLNWYIDVGEFF